MNDLQDTQADTALAWFKISIAWLAWLLGTLTLSNLGLFAALVFTVLQIIVLLRDKFGLFQKRNKS